MYVPAYSELQQIPKPARVKGDRWGYCGVAAISAATGVPPLAVHSLIPNWPGYTPSRTVIGTLDKLGYDCKRILLPRDKQRQWPLYRCLYPSQTALGRIYFSEGRWANSHWLVFHWNVTEFGAAPLFYDNADENCRDKWLFSWGWNFWPKPVKLKSLYFVVKR